MSNNVLLSIVSLLAGAIFGGVFRALFDRYTQFQESKGVATALAGEVSALIDLMGARSYDKVIADTIARLATPGRAVVPGDILSARTSQDYFVVFRALTVKLGLLGPLGARVVFFYSLGRAVVEDMGELRDRRVEVMRGDLTPAPEEVARWHAEFGGLLALTLDDGRKLVAELDAFKQRKFLGLFR